MKIISLLIAGIMYCVTCFAQQNVALSPSASINLPMEATKLNNQELKDFANGKFDINVISDNPKNVYKIDDMLVALYDAKYNFKQDHLERLKAEFDEMTKHSRTDLHYKSTIKSLKNNKALIICKFYKNRGQYNFYMLNSAKTNALNGVLQFDAADSIKATKLLYNLLNSANLIN